MESHYQVLSRCRAFFLRHRAERARRRSGVFIFIFRDLFWLSVYHQKSGTLLRKAKEKSNLFSPDALTPELRGAEHRRGSTRTKRNPPPPHSMLTMITSPEPTPCPTITQQRDPFHPAHTTLNTLLTRDVKWLPPTLISMRPPNITSIREHPVQLKPQCVFSRSGHPPRLRVLFLDTSTGNTSPSP